MNSKNMKENYHHKQMKNQRNKNRQKNRITKMNNILIREG